MKETGIGRALVAHEESIQAYISLTGRVDFNDARVLEAIWRRIKAQSTEAHIPEKRYIPIGIESVLLVALEQAIVHIEGKDMTAQQIGAASEYATNARNALKE